MTQVELELLIFYENIFFSEICSKQFSAHGNFIAHKKIHSGVRDHICPVCNKTFITSSDMSRHLSTHTGLKNFICDICNKAFTRLVELLVQNCLKSLKILFQFPGTATWSCISEKSTSMIA